MVLSFVSTTFQGYLEARAKKCENFHWFFGVWEDQIICFRDLLILLIKFRYSEKATKLEWNLPIFWHFYKECQKIGRFVFKMMWPVAFSKHLNFNKKMEELSSKSLIIKKIIILLQNWFFPIVPAIVGRHLFRSMLEKKSTEKSKESWSLTFFSKSQTQWEICAKFLVFVIKNDKNLNLAHCA